MENTSISRKQRRIIFLASIFIFFILFGVGLNTGDEQGGTYAVEIAPIDDPENVISGTAEISYNEDVDNFYFETITLDTGEIIYLYDEAAPVNFEDANEIHDDNEQFWNVYVNEEIDQLSTTEEVTRTGLNILYWMAIILMFFMRYFVRDFISILKVTKESPEELHKVDSWGYRLGCRLEQFTDNLKHTKVISVAGKLLALLMVLVWFLYQYNFI